MGAPISPVLAELLMDHILDKFQVLIQCCLSIRINCDVNTDQKRKKKSKQYDRDVTNDQLERSALSRHAFQNNHKFDFKNPLLLEIEHNYNKRIFLEELHFEIWKNSVNLKSLVPKNVSEFNSIIFR